MSTALSTLLKSLLSSIGLLVCLPILAQAQLGIGIGAGSGYWGGPGFWGSGFGHTGGGFYGMGMTVAPGHYTTSLPESKALKKAEKNNAVVSILDGYVKLCSPSKTSSPKPGNLPPAQQPTAPAACQVSPHPNFEQVDVVASPYGLNEWVGTRPDSTGHYRLTVLPGGYLIQASSPETPNLKPIEVIVEPGQTTHQDFQLTPELNR